MEDTSLVHKRILQNGKHPLIESGEYIGSGRIVCKEKEEMMSDGVYLSYRGIAVGIGMTSLIVVPFAVR